MLLLSIPGWRQGILYALPPAWSHTTGGSGESRSGRLAPGSCSFVFLLTGPQDDISVRFLQNSLQAAKNLVALVGGEQLENGIDQQAIKPRQYSAATKRIEDCFLNPGCLSIL